MLWKLADLIERDLEELAELELIDNGKPYAVARVADLPRDRGRQGRLTDAPVAA